jgi:hypothetical protein
MRDGAPRPRPTCRRHADCTDGASRWSSRCNGWPIVTMFEPLFVLLALSSGVALYLAAVRCARGQRAGA